MSALEAQELIRINTEGSEEQPQVTYDRRTSALSEADPSQTHSPSHATSQKCSIRCAVYTGCILFIFCICIALIAWVFVLSSEINDLKSEISADRVTDEEYTSTISPVPISIAPTMTPSAIAITTDSPTQFCEDEDYFKHVLKEEYTQNIGALIKNVDQDKKYEASGVTYDASRDVFWVVFDNLHSIAKLTSDLTRNDKNILVSSPTKIKIDKDDDGYEGITHDTETDVFYLVTESVGLDINDDDEVHHPILRSVVYDEQSSFTQTKICAMDFVAPTNNKGFEGIHIITIDDVKYFVTICEGNFCSYSDEGRTSGNGRILLYEYTPIDITTDETYSYLVSEDIECLYPLINTYEVPSYVNFTDYSDIAFMLRNDTDVDNLYYVAIVSQESAAFWMGEVQWSLAEGPYFDEEFEDEVYPFPMGGDCEAVFCNVEGVTFVNEYEFVMVSDSLKRGDQNWLCEQKEQSIHILKLP